MALWRCPVSQFLCQTKSPLFAHSLKCRWGGWGKTPPVCWKNIKNWVNGKPGNVAGHSVNTMLCPPWKTRQGSGPCRHVEPAPGNIPWGMQCTFYMAVKKLESLSGMGKLSLYTLGFRCRSLPKPCSAGKHALKLCLCIQPFLTSWITWFQALNKALQYKFQVLLVLCAHFSAH